MNYYRINGLIDELGITAAIIAIIYKQYSNILSLDSNLKRQCAQCIELSIDKYKRNRQFYYSCLLSKFNPLLELEVKKMNIFICNYCNKQVHGLLIKCMLCNHGGHLIHINKFSSSCPKCLCLCQFNNI